MAFKRSAVRSRISPPSKNLETATVSRFFLFCLYVRIWKTPSINIITNITHMCVSHLEGVFTVILPVTLAENMTEFCHYIELKICFVSHIKDKRFLQG